MEEKKVRKPRQTRTLGLKFEKSDLDWFQEWTLEHKTTATATLARFISACRRGEFKSPYLIEHEGMTKIQELEERLKRLEQSRGQS